MAIGETITDLKVAPTELSRVKLAASRMAACGEPGEPSRCIGTYHTVRAVGMRLWPPQGIETLVGKDSLAMRTIWTGRRGGLAVSASEAAQAGDSVRAWCVGAERRGRHVPEHTPLAWFEPTSGHQMTEQ